MNGTRNDYIVRKLYYSFVKVSILSALTATVGMLIDNIIVGRYLGPDAMGVVGPVSLLLSAFGNICSGGGTARASQAMGRGTGSRSAVHLPLPCFLRFLQACFSPRAVCFSRHRLRTFWAQRAY